MLPLIFFLVEAISTVINYLVYLLVHIECRYLLHQKNLPFSFLVTVFKISDSALVKYRLFINTLFKNLFPSVLDSYGKARKILHCVATSWRNILCYLHSNDDTDSSSESEHDAEKSYPKGKAKKFLPEKRNVRKLEAAKDVHSRPQTRAWSKLSSSSVIPPTIFYPRLSEGKARKSFPVKRKEKLEAAKDVHSPTRTDPQSQLSSGSIMPHTKIRPELRDLHTPSCSKETLDKRTTASHSSKDHEMYKPSTSSLQRGPDLHRPRSELISDPGYRTSTSYVTGFPEETLTKSSYLDSAVSHDSETSSGSSDSLKAEKKRAEEDFFQSLDGAPSEIIEEVYKMMKEELRAYIFRYRYRLVHGYTYTKDHIDECSYYYETKLEQSGLTCKRIRRKGLWYKGFEHCYEPNEKDLLQSVFKKQQDNFCKVAKKGAKSWRRIFERVKKIRGRKNESSSEVDDEGISDDDKTHSGADCEQKWTVTVSKVDKEHALNQTGARSEQSSNVTPSTIIHPRLREGKARKSLPVKRKEMSVAPKDMHSPAQTHPECRSLSKSSTIPRTEIRPGVRDSRRQPSSEETSDERIAASHSSKEIDTTSRAPLHQRRLDLHKRQSLRNLAIKEYLTTASTGEVLDSEAVEPGISSMDTIRCVEECIHDAANEFEALQKRVREQWERSEGPERQILKDMEYKIAKSRYRMERDKVGREKCYMRLEHRRERRKYLSRDIEMKSWPYFEKKGKDSERGEKATSIKSLKTAHYEGAKIHCKFVKKDYESVKIERGRKDESSSEVDDVHISGVDDENSPHSD